MPDTATTLLVLTIAVALAFDFTNGFHDTANAVATTIGTRALTPRTAIALSAVLNLMGAVVTTQFLHSKVANTIGGLLSPARGVAPEMIVAALLGAIAWNLITWRAGLPSSSSHALIGGLIGMGLAAYGLGAVRWDKVYPVLIALVTSPLAGLLIAYVVMVILLNLCRRLNPGRANVGFRRLQILSASFVSFSHGANDAQKTMAIIALALVSTHHLKSFSVPLWVVLLAGATIGFGTYAGGWRIIRTMSTRIIKLTPVDGFAAETVGASVIQVATQVGLPVSTTHVVAGSVIGVGATHRISAVRWGVARRIAAAWVLTVPASAAMAAGVALLVSAIGWVAGFTTVALACLALLLLSRRRPPVPAKRQLSPAT
ncbi:MAG: anion permease [Candidatus Dormibacteria bacterium]